MTTLVSSILEASAFAISPVYSFQDFDGCDSRLGIIGPSLSLEYQIPAATAST